jgi:hypothetical protein
MHSLSGIRIHMLSVEGSTPQTARPLGPAMIYMNLVALVV